MNRYKLDSPNKMDIQLELSSAKLIDPLDHLKQKWKAPFKLLCRPYFPLDVYDVEILWNTRMRSRAGVCKPGERLIELNPHILKTEKDIEETLIHELCHFVISSRWPRAEPHGVKWQELMRLMGFNPKRCHQLKPKAVHKQRRWPLNCPCKKHEVSTTIYNRIVSGQKYRCLNCRGVLFR